MHNVLQIVYLIPLISFLGFVINGLGRKQMSRSTISLVGCGTVLISFALSVWAFLQIRNGNAATIQYFDFIHVGRLVIPFEFKIDQLSGLFLLIITGVGFLIHWYSTAYMKEEKTADFGKYFSFLNLFVFSMLLLVMAGNFVVMYMGWEGVGLCSYFLIGFWFKVNENNKAGSKAFIMNRIGDLAFLIAVFWLVAKLNTVSFDQIFTTASLDRLSTLDITVITILLFIGATGKSAQIPLFTWLPDAMAGPTPVSALIHAATMVTAGVYMIARSNVLYSLAPVTLNVIAYVGLATALVAASIAIKQNDIKKVLAYSTVSQLGFMFLALGCGAYTAAVFHVLTHAFFKALLFLGSGSVIHAMGGEQDIRKMGGLSSKLKITFITFLIASIAIAGIPPFSGFFSKDAILLSAFAKIPVMYGLALFAALLTALYIFRLLFLTFTGSFRGTAEQKNHLHESPPAMTIPLIVLAILAFAGGLIGIPEILMQGGDRLGEFLSPVLKNAEIHVAHSTEMMLMVLSTVLVLIVIGISWMMYKKYRDVEAKGFGKFLQNKWYVDEIYDAVVVKPLKRLGSFLGNVFDKKIIDGIVNGVGRMVQYSGRQLRLLQSGQAGNYILLMVFSMVIIFVIQYFLRK